MANTRKKILFVMRNAAHQTAQAQEAFDILLMASSFEHKISLLFINDGIFQLLKNQDTKLLGIQNFSSSYKALPLYDIDAVYIGSNDLTQRGLNQEDVMIDAVFLSDEKISGLILQHDVIFNV